MTDPQPEPPAWPRGWILFGALVTAIILLGFWLVLPAKSAAMEFCVGPVRVTCVVDGDTFWLDGEKIRIADIDAPETGGACEAERILAARASGRLAALLEGNVEIVRQGKDRYGRTLAVVMENGRSVGLILVEEELARPWRGKRESWCATLPAGS